ncbi:hypothetical protein Tco_0348536, partial [Tanacetum coccineum]
MRKTSRGRKDEIFCQLHYFSYFHFSLGCVERILEKKEGTSSEFNYSRCPFISQKMERRIDVLIGSVGTDGARTRNIRLDRAVFLKNKSVIPSDSRLANCWAELDLNQRRHIANEFTVLIIKKDSRRNL